MLLLMIPGAGVPMCGSAEAAPPELSAGTVVGIPARASVTVPVGAEEILANGDVVVHPLAATAVDGTTFKPDRSTDCADDSEPRRFRPARAASDRCRSDEGVQPGRVTPGRHSQAGVGAGRRTRTWSPG